MAACRAPGSAATCERLYWDSIRRRRQLDAERQLASAEAAELEAAECTFAPVTDKRSKELVQVSEDLSARRRAACERRARASPPVTFHPSVNHNFDAKLNDWAQGVSVFDRLYGKALLSMERDMTFAQETDGDADFNDQKRFAAERRVHDDFDAVFAELNSETSPGNTTDGLESASARRYLEDPKERLQRLEALRCELRQHFSFSPEIRDYVPPQRAASPPKNEPRRRKTMCTTSAAVSEAHKVRRDSLLSNSARYSASTAADRLLCQPLGDRSVDSRAPTRCEVCTHIVPPTVLRRSSSQSQRVPILSQRLHDTTSCRDSALLEILRDVESNARAASLTASLEHSRMSWREARKAVGSAVQPLRTQ